MQNVVQSKQPSSYFILPFVICLELIAGSYFLKNSQHSHSFFCFWWMAYSWWQKSQGRKNCITWCNQSSQPSFNISSCLCPWSWTHCKSYKECSFPSFLILMDDILLVTKNYRLEKLHWSSCTLSPSHGKKLFFSSKIKFSVSDG